MVVYTYNNCLNFPLSSLQLKLNQFINDVVIKYASEPGHMAKTTCYTVKSANKNDIIDVCNHLFKAPPAALFVNQTLKNNPLKFLTTSLDKAQINNFHYNLSRTHSDLSPIPRVSTFDGDQKMQMAAFIQQVCLLNRTAFFKDMLFAPTNPQSCTWQYVGPREFLVHYLLDTSLPAKFQKQLLNSAHWLLTEGANTKAEMRTHRVFVPLRFNPALFEFKENKYYNFEKNQLVTQKPQTKHKDSLQQKNFQSCSIYVDQTWNTLPSPQPVISFLKLVVDAQPHELLEFCTCLSSIFHPITDRKEQPGIWISGGSNTFKSAFVNAFLQHNINQHLVTTIVQTKQTTFQYAPLRGVTNGVLHIDEFRDKIFQPAANLINIMDGQKTMIEQKYKEAISTQFKGQVIVTTNQLLQSIKYQHYDLLAVEARFAEYHFRIQDQQTHLDAQTLFEQIQPNHWVSFAIFCNLARLILDDIEPEQIITPNSWPPFQHLLLSNFLLQDEEKQPQHQPSQPVTQGIQGDQFINQQQWLQPFLHRPESPKPPNLPDYVKPPAKPGTYTFYLYYNTFWKNET